MSKTMFLKRYELASQFTTPQMDSYSYETISKICGAILEAALLKEELNNVADVSITLSQALSKIEAEKLERVIEKAYLENSNKILL